MRLNRYPHKLYKIVTGDKTEDEFGQDIAGTTTKVFVSNCYEQVMGNATEVKADNGEVYQCSSKIFLPVGAESVPTGARIEIREDNDVVRREGIVRRESGKDVKHSRLWV